MPVFYLQSNVSFYSVSGSGGDLPCAYLSGNGTGNIGLAWVTTHDATIPSSVDDSNGNNWFLLQELPSNLGTQSWWVCPVLNGGANIVTAHGLTASNGGPNLTILEYIPPCLPGEASIVAFNPPSLSFVPPPPLIHASMFRASSGKYFQTLISGIWDDYNSAEITVRTWSVTTKVYAISAGVRIQYNMPTTPYTGAVADCSIGNPNALNTIEWDYTPSTPPLGANWAYLTGVLITTKN